MKKLSLFLVALTMLLVSCKPEAEKPTVVTKSVGEVTETTAKVVGQVTADGGAEVTERGVCWNVTTAHEDFVYRMKDVEGGLGVFTLNIPSLVPNTKYYVRTYAINEAGTSYGEDISFTTEKEEEPEEPGDEPEEPGDEPEEPGDGDENEDPETPVDQEEPGDNDENDDPETPVDPEEPGDDPEEPGDGDENDDPETPVDPEEPGDEPEEPIVPEEPEEDIMVCEYVDMGFASGVKWATCNVGATTPEGYGEHYAWGEIETKEVYTWQNGNCLTYGKELGDISGNAEYDVATAKWGGGWRTPRLADIYELVTECQWIWAKVNGVNGFNVVSKINGNHIFLPAAGFMNTLAAIAAGTEGVLDQGAWGYYWTTTPYDESYVNKEACGLLLSSGGYQTEVGLRYNGFSIRPVIDE